MTLRLLLDEREIRHRLNRFAWLADGRDWAAVPDVFATDLTFDYGSGEQRGIEALVATFRRFLDPCGPSQHLLGTIDVAVDGDTAASRAYVQARHQGRDEKAGLFFDSSGEYHDDWRRGSAGWRIVRRRAVWFMHKGDAGVLAS